ncbi:DUF2752 domain-containing protein [Cellulomonas edaphi]|uniref:DUF2752 domain-containing protein n=1 Tax=Cellulomonas edaphi TaxID=3053468 RepID=A0ABT7S619_9CELL|nr:DUF2752 domain-containing protein [Cellulomons edaphi]MDM7831036.1 DUF2752 domain-containing protein [Cellulomons edaphi]
MASSDHRSPTAVPTLAPGTHRGIVARCAGPAAVAAAAVGALAVLARVDPNAPGHYPTCPFLFLTGLYCPGCGALRALHDLTQLDLAGAWGMNPLLVLVLPALVAAWVGWTVRSARGRPRSLVVPARWINAFLVLVLVYWVARNVPALAPWLAP